MINSPFKLLSALLCICLLTSCKSCKDDIVVSCYDETDPDCENYDPCHNTANADWVIPAFEHNDLLSYDPAFFNDPDFYVQDTLYNGYNIFKATKNSNTYKWEIGSDPTIYTQKEVNLLYSCCTGPLNVSLKVTKDEQASCLGDDGFDMLTRNLFLTTLPKNEANACVGKFSGKDDFTDGSNRIVEYFIDSSNIFALPIHKVVGLIPCANSFLNNDLLAYVSQYNRWGAYHHSYNDCTRHLRVMSRMVTQDSVIIKYKFVTPETWALPNSQHVEIERTFKGIRTQ
jgi:hypothetical protein